MRRCEHGNQFNNEATMRYILYARKSSESEDRQVQSIDDQVKRLKDVASNLNLHIADILIESKSAKDPNKRPQFQKLLDMLQEGKAEGILCWQINRLSRNPVDSGEIQWLLQKSIIKSIQTIDREYRPEDNVLLFSVESGMSNQYILELSKNVKRGLQSKIEKGVYPGIPPQGYLNDKEDKTIVIDPERFNLVRKMWDLMLTGYYTPPQILKIATDEWGYRTFQYKRKGNKTLSRSGIYKIFSNIFYTGDFERNGEQHKGVHEPMITFEEFDRVQILLGRKGQARPQKQEFAFTGFIRCGECGCLYTAEKKKKVLKSTGETKYYTYYHCTRRKKDVDCSQRKHIREEVLEEQIDDVLSTITILPEFKDWAVEILNKQNDKEIEDRTKVYESHQKALAEAQRQLDNLTRMRYRDIINDEEYLKEKKVLQAELTGLQRDRDHVEDRAKDWIELTEKTFYFATYARHAFQTGDLKTKKEILMSLGKNVRTKDGKVEIELNEWLQPIQDGYSALETEYKRLEPEILGSKEGKKDEIEALRLVWRRRRDSNPRPPA